jgi:hypothetical protein
MKIKQEFNTYLYEPVFNRKEQYMRKSLLRRKIKSLGCKKGTAFNMMKKEPPDKTKNKDGYVIEFVPNITYDMPYLTMIDILARRNKYLKYLKENNIPIRSCTSTTLPFFNAMELIELRNKVERLTDAFNKRMPQISEQTEKQV